MLTQHLGDGEHHVGGGHAGLGLTGQLEADHAGDEHRDGLAEHGCLCLDATDAPAENAEAVLHGGVRVGADAGVGVGLLYAVGVRPDHDRACEVLDVDLVHDAGAGRDDLEVVEGALAPAQELVALAVALVFDVHVALEGLGVSEGLDDHRVVDHHFRRSERVHLVRVAAELLDGLTHGGEVDDARHAGEVLHDHARRRELDLDAGVGGGVPVRDRGDVVFGDVRAVLGAKQVLGENFEGVGEFVGSLDSVQTEDLVRVLTDRQRAAGAKGIDTHRFTSAPLFVLSAGGGCAGPDSCRQLHRSGRKQWAAPHALYRRF